MNTTLLLTTSTRRAAALAASSASKRMSVVLLPVVRPPSLVVFLENSSRCFSETPHDKQDTGNNNNNNKISKTEYRQHLDKMMHKTTKMEDSMEALKETYAKKKQHATTVKWMDPADIDRLFDESKQHKEDIMTELAELRAMLKNVATRKFDAVDGPDGESDWHLKEEMQQVNHIIDDAAVLENKDEVMQQRHNMQNAAFAVDAPDGDSDGHVQEELQEIKHIIDDTRATDKNSVEYKRKMKDEQRRMRAGDPEHW